MCLCMKARGEFAAFLKLYIYIYICDADKSILLTSQWPSASFLCCYIYMTKHYALFYLCMSFGINTDITLLKYYLLYRSISLDKEDYR